MKILYILNSRFEDNTSANIRNRALINGLISNGHHVTILAEESIEKSIERDLSIEYYNVDKLVKEVISKPRFNKLKRIAHYYYSKLNIYDRRKNNVTKIPLCIYEMEFDLVISSSDPKSAHLIAEKFISNYNRPIRWIQYWGDPFYDDINKKNKYFLKRIFNEEKRLLNKADKVVYVSPFTLQKQRDLFTEVKDKMDFVPTPSEQKNYQLKESYKYDIGYFGDFYTSDREIQPLINVAKSLELKLILRGNTDIPLDKFKNINYGERISLSELIQIEEDTEILICLANKNGAQIPGKLFYYAGTNKKVLFIIDGPLKNDVKSFFEKYDRFYICSNTEKEIINTIRYIQQDKRSFAPLDEFSVSYVSKEFLK